ncbi:CBS domain-containing protein [Microbacterium sp. NPDC077644]|uniref:CBS domain-containing protein n=1 Tax=Microbacterium sp. NPDC077644 TaxID=3155055 RepID=UPI00344CEFD2
MDETNLRLRVDYVPSATIEPVITVRASDTLERAVTLMRLHNFSQLPVMRGKGKRPEGVVSWRSIGRELLRNAAAELKDCIDDSVAIVNLDDDLLETIDRINQDDYVLVVKENGDISGIVTSADLGDALAAIARPYLLVSQCEDAMRHFIRRGLELSIINAGDINRATLSKGRAFAGAVDDLPFGDLINILSMEALWKGSSFRTDPSALRADLNLAAQLRNEIMHFRDHTPKTEAVRDRLPFVIAELRSVLDGLPTRS